MCFHHIHPSDHVLLCVCVWVCLYAARQRLMKRKGTLTVSNCVFLSVCVIDAHLFKCAVRYLAVSVLLVLCVQS